MSYIGLYSTKEPESRVLEPENGLRFGYFSRSLGIVFGQNSGWVVPYKRRFYGPVKRGRKS